MACFVELTLIEIKNMEVIGPIIVNFTKVKYFRGFDEDGYSITRIVFSLELIMKMFLCKKT
jgi:hypothetical protein